MTYTTGKSAKAVALLALLALAGCGGPGPGGDAAATASARGGTTAAGAVQGGATPRPDRTDGCLGEDRARTGSIDLQGASGVRPAYFQQADGGAAKVAVVFSHQAEGSLCDWLPYLPAFTRAGYAVLAATVGGSPSRDIPAALSWLGTKGVTAVVLVGASKGATGSLVAAGAPTPLPVAAVVSLSGPWSWDGEDAHEALKALRAPEFFAAEEDDSPFAGNARQMHDFGRSPVNELKIYPGGDHGADLLADGALPDVLAFLARNAPAG
ncbi:alpha/beta hydrolase family protein [Kitasatospora sp. NPDC101176]|uniref:alpha/beta hydrolase family protein n=1 Tax=Kitasatospora sp. NPDC101176 TaxID=3364099 RepID=UPI0038224C7E